MLSVKLGNCIKEVVEKTTENNQYEVLSVTKDGIFSQKEFFKKQIASKNNIGYKVIRKNNLVFSTMNLWMGSLDVLTNYEIGIVSPAYKIFEFNKELMLPEFANYFMKSHYMIEKYKDCSEQGASIVRRNLNLKQLLNIKINIPEVQEQKQIADALEKVDNIIKDYEKLIIDKDQMIKSQFVEMLKRSKLKEYKLSKIAKYWNGQTYKPTDINDQGMIVLRSSNIQNNELDFNDIVRINNDIKSKNIVKENDILMCSRNGSANLVGKVAIIKNIPEKMCFGTFMMIIRSNYYKFLYYYFQSKEFRKNISVETTTQINQITVNMLDKVVVKIPENNEMEKFILIEELIDKQKFELEKQKKNYELLKKGIMQKLIDEQQ